MVTYIYTFVLTIMNSELYVLMIPDSHVEVKLIMETNRLTTVESTFTKQSCTIKKWQ